MMYKNHFSVLIMVFLLGICSQIDGQNRDTIHQLSEVLIYGSKDKTANVNFIILEIDSNLLQVNRMESISELLINQGLNIQSYGQGAVSGLNIRGLSSNQSGIIWNGVNINAPNVGMTDLSLLPTVAFDEISIAQSGVKIAQSQGMLGGSLLLEQKMLFEDSFQMQLGTQVSSNSNFQQYSKAKFSSKKWFNQIDFVNNNCNNTFSYINTIKPNLPKEKRNHAAFYNNMIMTSNGYNFGNGNVISLNIWGQKGNREIPGTLTSDTGTALQHDMFLRSILNYKYAGKRLFSNIKIANMQESLIFEDTIIDIYSTIKTSTWKYLMDAEYILNSRFKIQVGYNLNYDFANIKAYDEHKTRSSNTGYIGINYQSTNSRIAATGFVRKSWIDKNNIPLNYNISCSYKIIDFLKAFVNLSSNFRTPTLNDLYWVPGGNLSLKPEESMQKEFGFYFNNQNKSCKFRIEAKGSFYQIEVNNWIAWKPTNYGYWSPINVNFVNSQGFEGYIKCQYQFNKWKFMANSNLNYGKSIMLENKNVSQNKESKILPYAPPELGSIGAKVCYKNSFLHYYQRFSSYRFTNFENTEYLRGFDVANLALGREVRYKQHDFSFNFIIENLYNNVYQTLAWIPTPLRTYKIQILYQFNKNYNVKP